MEKYIPDIYAQSVFTINYDKLINRGIKCLLFDLDNTLALYNEKTPNKRVCELFEELKAKGFKLILFSNSSKIRLKPFKETLDVDCCARAFKPRKDKFLIVLEEFGYTINEVAIIGDQIFTDILGGNRVGITTILVNPIGKDFIVTIPNRIREKRLLKRLRDKNLFSKGRYYD